MKLQTPYWTEVLQPKMCVCVCVFNVFNGCNIPFPSYHPQCNQSKHFKDDRLRGRSNPLSSRRRHYGFMTKNLVLLLTMHILTALCS